MSPQQRDTALSAFYASAFLWNNCMGMLQVLMPLYAFSLGFSLLKISSLIALPALAEVAVRFLGSALSDRFGERRILQVCYVLMALAGALLVAAESFLLLLLVQSIASFSRSNFWISIQSLASQLPGANVGKQLGRLASCNYAGNLIGLNLGGVLAALLGYPLSFLVLTALAVVSILLGLALPQVEAKPKGRSVWEITRGIGQFLRYRRIWLGISASYAAALPASLTQSIYPVYFASLDYGEQWIGAAISARSLTPALIGVMLGAAISTARQRGIFTLGMTGLAISLMASGVTEYFILNAACVALLGAAGAVMDLLYQVQTSEWSKAKDRSVAMASTGLGWVICPLTAPVIVAWLAEGHGFSFAFLVSGAFLLLMAAGSRLWHRWLAPAESPGERS